MSTNTDIQRGERRIEQLTDHETGWIHALATNYNWPDWKLALVFKISASDVRKVVENWLEPWGTAEKNLRWQPRHREPVQELPKKKPRKRRCDARFATTADRQAAYRARMKEKRLAAMEQVPPSSDTDSQPPADSELTCDDLSVPAAEADSQRTETDC